MEIGESKISGTGLAVDILYREEDPRKDMGDARWGSTVAYCFYDDKFVIVRSRNYWVPPGGRIEEGEAIEDANTREVREETNMEVIRQELIGYQDSKAEGETPQRHPFFFCIVKPLGEFIADPDKSVTEVKLVDAKDYKQYFDWGKIGDRVMSRALELKNSLL